MSAQPRSNGAGLRDVAHDDTRQATLDSLTTHVLVLERALLRANSHLIAVTDSMAEGVFTVDSAGLIDYMNRAAEDLLGRSLEQAKGRPMHPMIHSRRPDGSPLPLSDCGILSSLRDGRVARAEDDVFIRRDDSELSVSYTAAPFATADERGGCVVVFEDISERKARELLLASDIEKLGWIGRIEEALAHNGFVLHAQPIVDLASGALVQRELLLRMRHPQGSRASGLIAPGYFLPAAEEFGLVTKIDRWVIDRATEIAATGLLVELNVSGRSISDLSLVDYVKLALERSGADPHMIVFEITETTMVANQGAARVFVERLHGLGCKIALDDFGTGYGGFTYVKQLPIDFLKIDVEFVRDLRYNPASRSVIQAIVKLAQGFQLQTIAEGVEDEETMRLVCDLGVTNAQGYHIGRPGPLPRPATGVIRQQLGLDRVSNVSHPRRSQRAG